LSNFSNAEIAWRSDLTAAHAEATSQNKPLLLHFYTDNCVWCDRLEAGAFQSADVSNTLSSGFVPIKIHAGKSPELAKMFNVTKFPTDVVVTPTGQPLAHGVSPQDPKRYVAMLAKASSQMPAAAPPQVPAGAPVPPDPGMMPGQMQQQIAANGARPNQTPPNQSATVASAKQGQPTANSYNRPGMSLPGGASARLAGARTDGMSLGMPAQMVESPELAPSPESAPSPTASAATPKLAMEGFCAVTVIDEDKWQEGNPKFGVVHLGKLYLFATAEKMETFLADPTPYTPVLNEIDVVRFFEERQIVPGKRRFGMRDPIHQRMFFFADQAAMDHFFNEYERYTDAAIEVMAQAVKDANPGVR
jgi:protein disulfide-isomerase